MGELKSVALFGEAEKCHKEQQKAHCPFHPAPAEAAQAEGKKKGCCDDEHELLQIEDQEQPVVDVLPGIATALVPDFPPLLFTYRAPHPRPRKNTSFENYRPPPLIPDPVREFQVFRI